MKTVNYGNSEGAIQNFGINFPHVSEPCTDLLIKASSEKLMPVGLIESLDIQIELRWKMLEAGVEYSLEALLGQEYWKKLNDYQQFLAHSCVKYLLTKRGLKLSIIKHAPGYMITNEL